jgi:predicted transcriptional regulator
MTMLVSHQQTPLVLLWLIDGCTCAPPDAVLRLPAERGRFDQPGFAPERRDGSMTDIRSKTDFIGLTAEIVSAYVSNNTVAFGEIPALINQVHSALLRVSDGEVAGAGPALKPAVPIKRSIHPDYVVCLEDGKKFKSLRRHLRSQYGMTPEQYREKWGLPHDYPMVAPNYAAARSHLAKQMGLGRQRRRRR